MLIKAFVPILEPVLGIYLPLIVVNCIILGRAEMFASKNNVADSALDGLGMGLGFTAVLLILGSVREILGKGSWFGIQLFSEQYWIKIMSSAPGGFFTYGCLIAVLAAIMLKNNKKLSYGKRGCVNCEGCAGCEEVGNL